MARRLRYAKESINEKKEEEEVAKKVVLDYATVKSAVQTIREFEKEYGISMLERKGLEQAQSILKKHEQQDKLQHFVEEKISEKIAPIDKKINKLTEMISSMMGQNEEEQRQPSIEHKKQIPREQQP